MTPPLIEALKSVTEEDLDQVTRDLEEKEKEVSSLRQIQKIIDARLGKDLEKRGPGGRRKKKVEEQEPSSPPVKAGTILSHRERAREFLLKRKTPATALEIANSCGIPHSAIEVILNHPDFVKTAIGIGLSSKCK